MTEYLIEPINTSSHMPISRVVGASEIDAKLKYLKQNRFSLSRICELSARAMATSPGKLWRMTNGRKVSAI